jgi:hypothetical protein
MNIYTDDILALYNCSSTILCAKATDSRKAKSSWGEPPDTGSE